MFPQHTGSWCESVSGASWPNAHVVQHAAAADAALAAVEPAAHGDAKDSRGAAGVHDG